VARTINITGNWREGGPEHEWAGSGTVDQYGAIHCTADLSDQVYDEIEEQIVAGRVEGSVTVHDADLDRPVTYGWAVTTDEEA